MIYGQRSTRRKSPGITFARRHCPTDRRTSRITKTRKAIFVLETPCLACQIKSRQDRRIHLIHITAKGAAEIEKAKTVIKSVNEKIKSGFSEKEIGIFKKVLNSFFDKFDRWPQ